ncbi:MAG: pilin [Patescibacteria group bacterium]
MGGTKRKIFAWAMAAIIVSSAGFLYFSLPLASADRNFPATGDYSVNHYFKFHINSNEWKIIRQVMNADSQGKKLGEEGIGENQLRDLIYNGNKLLMGDPAQFTYGRLYVYEKFGQSGFDFPLDLSGNKRSAWLLIQEKMKGGPDLHVSGNKRTLTPEEKVFLTDGISYIHYQLAPPATPVVEAPKPPETPVVTATVAPAKPVRPAILDLQYSTRHKAGPDSPLVFVIPNATTQLGSERVKILSDPKYPLGAFMYNKASDSRIAVDPDTLFLPYGLEVSDLSAFNSTHAEFINVVMEIYKSIIDRVQASGNTTDDQAKTDLKAAQTAYEALIDYVSSNYQPIDSLLNFWAEKGTYLKGEDVEIIIGMPSVPSNWNYVSVKVTEAGYKSATDSALAQDNNYGISIYNDDITKFPITDPTTGKREEHTFWKTDGDTKAGYHGILAQIWGPNGPLRSRRIVVNLEEYSAENKINVSSKSINQGDTLKITADISDQQAKRDSGLSCFFYISDGLAPNPNKDEGGYWLKGEGMGYALDKCAFDWNTDTNTTVGLHTVGFTLLKVGLHPTFIKKPETPPFPWVYTQVNVCKKGSSSCNSDIPLLGISATNTAINQGTKTTITGHISDPNSEEVKGKQCYFYVGDRTGTNTWIPMAKKDLSDCKYEWNTINSEPDLYGWRVNLQAPGLSGPDTNPEAEPKSKTLFVRVCEKNATSCQAPNQPDNPNPLDPAGDGTAIVPFNAEVSSSSLITIAGLTADIQTLEQLLFKTKYYWLPLFLGVLSFIAILFGGFMILTSGGNEEQAKKGKNSILYGAIGLAIGTVSYVIIIILIRDFINK